MHLLRTFTLFVIFATVPASAAEPARISIAFGSKPADPFLDIRHFALSPEVVFDPGSRTLRLAKSVLVADEMGATDFHQTLNITGQVQAKKIFDIGPREGDGAELFLFGSASEVRFNGEALEKPKKLDSTGWQRVVVPARLLRTSENEVVFRGPGQLLIEPTAKPGRSSRSTDGGVTWSASDMGSKGNGPGEIVARLRLNRHARTGWAESLVFDLWTDRPEGIARPGRIAKIIGLGALAKDQPDGTHLQVLVRTGATPQPDDHWTGWKPLDQDWTPEADSKPFRWAQLRFEFSTEQVLSTPSLPAKFSLDYNFVPDDATPKDKLKLLDAGKTTPRDALPSSTVFTWQEPSARLTRLRQRHQLDKVIAPGKSEIEQLMLLRHWVRHQWHSAWEGGAASWMPPWDAIIILDSMDRSDCLTMCTHYAAVYTQCCLALGWNARHCILDHHCVSEVYVNEHRKWVMMDAGNSKPRPECHLHFERNGIPLSTLELHQAVRSGKTDDIKVCFIPAALAEKIADLCRPAPPPKKTKGPEPRPETVSAAELPKYPVCGLENYRRYAFPARNNYLSSLLPGELYQGWSSYFYDGYCWVGDSADKPERSPEYSRHLSPDRPQDIDCGLNWTRIHLARTDKLGELRVHLETRTPNLAHMELRHDDGKEWKAGNTSFVWKLKPGKNVLAARSVNRFERPGIEETVAVEWNATK